MLRKEFLRLLREDEAFREEVRRQLLTDRLLTLPDRVEENFERAFRLIADLAERMNRVETQIAGLTEQVRENSRQIAENSRQIALLREQVRENSRQIALLREQVQENSRQIAENSRQISRLAEQVSRLVTKMGEFERTQSRFGQVLGVHFEDLMQEGILGFLRKRGYRVPDRMWVFRSGDLEIDGVAEVETPDGIRVWVLAESAGRVFSEDIRRWGEILRDRRTRAALEKEGIAPPWLPWMFGIRLGRSAEDEARRWGIGLADRAGVLVEPALWNGD